MSTTDSNPTTIRPNATTTPLAASTPNEPYLAPSVSAPVRTLGTVSLVLGIVSVVSGFQFAIGIAAIIVGILAMRQEPASRTFAIWGIVTGAISTIGLFWGALAFAAFFPFFGFAGFGGLEGIDFSSIDFDGMF